MSLEAQKYASVREVIKSFLDERLATKLEKLKPDDPKYLKTQQQLEYEVWIADAAHRVTQLQVVTHSLKAIHPDAKGTNLFVMPDSLPKSDQVSSHLLKSNYSADVVGNAAALDVYKFLKLEFNGRTLLDMALENAPQFVEAMNADAEIAQQQTAAFAAIVEPKGTEASSTRAKQIYWLTGDDPTDDNQYHLLAPLYPTSLVHQLYQHIQEDRFGEPAKAARQARRDKKHSENGYSDYPNLAVQKLGGTKPQNISQLNSERGGTNYLLASLPPQWRSNPINPPLHTDSIFPRFGRQREVQWLTRNLLKFLKSNPQPNMGTRDKVDGFINALIEELVVYAARFDQLEPGWSTDEHCRLAEAEKLWLDAWRGETDEVFLAHRARMEWPEQIEDRFAKWVNHQLRGLPVGDSEHKEWLSHISSRLNLFREVLV